MSKSENTWDRLLQIKTIGRDDANADAYRFPYEPTPYCVLERLADRGLIGKDDVVLDYGAGKGRVGFFLAHETKAKVIGVEYDARMIARALENRRTAVSGAGIDFVETAAEDYAVSKHVNRCYFFNPFSVEILQRVMARITESYYEHPREVFLFFYYPSDDYISYLMSVDALDFYDEIECEDLFPGNNVRERIMIFQLSY